MRLTAVRRWIRGPVVRSVLGILVIAGTLVGCASSPHGGGVQVVDRNQRDRVTSGQYLVRRGDTLWSIAERLRPEGDPRPIVDELSARSGGAGIVAGDRIDVSGLGD